MSYIGNQVTSVPHVVDVFSGTGSATSFGPLVRSPAGTAAIAVFVNGAYRTPGLDYTLNGDYINFTTPPAVGVSNIVIHHLGNGTTTQVPSDQSITGTKLQENSVRGNNIVAGQITGNLIGSGAITSNHIADGTVIAVDIANLSVNGPKLDIASVSGNNIGLGAVSGNQIGLNAITGNLIVPSAVTTNHIVQLAITGNLIAADAISGNNIVPNAIRANNIVADTITGNLVSSGAIRSNNIVAGQVGGNTISASVIGANHITSGAITGNLIPNGAISGNNIVDNAIRANNIVAGQIVGNLLSTGSVSGNNIDVGAVSGNQIGLGAVSGNNIGINSINASNSIVEFSITGNLIGTGAISANNFAGGGITSNVLSSNLSISVSKVTETLGINTTVIGSKTTNGANVNLDVNDGTVYYFSSNTSGNVTFNLRGNTINTFDSSIEVGNTVSVVVTLRHNTAAYRSGVNVMIDGGLIATTRPDPDSSNLILYAGNTLPVYSELMTALESNVIGLTVMKKAANSYIVFMSNTLFGLA